eukprot:gb/GEZN01000344.1/.p1 GENE.gb/GEZN01000344.1/~~gb/GEZN01000344.1/.p1  ORF type:complete len:1326 (+),score=190.61 gb/GEZN01000344.1/:695-4672(+)
MDDDQQLTDSLRPPSRNDQRPQDTAADSAAQSELTTSTSVTGVTVKRRIKVVQENKGPRTYKLHDELQFSSWSDLKEKLGVATEGVLSYLDEDGDWIIVHGALVSESLPKPLKLMWTYPSDSSEFLFDLPSHEQSDYYIIKRASQAGGVTPQRRFSGNSETSTQTNVDAQRLLELPSSPTASNFLTPPSPDAKHAARARQAELQGEENKSVLCAIPKCKKYADYNDKGHRCIPCLDVGKISVSHALKVFMTSECGHCGRTQFKDCKEKKLGKNFPRFRNCSPDGDIETPSTKLTEANEALYNWIKENKKDDKLKVESLYTTHFKSDTWREWKEKCEKKLKADKENNEKEKKNEEKQYGTKKFEQDYNYVISALNDYAAFLHCCSREEEKALAALQAQEEKKTSAEPQAQEEKKAPAEQPLWLKAKEKYRLALDISLAVFGGAASISRTIASNLSNLLQAHQNYQDAETMCQEACLDTTLTFCPVCAIKEKMLKADQLSFEKGERLLITPEGNNFLQRVVTVEEVRWPLRDNTCKLKVQGAPFDEQIIVGAAHFHVQVVAGTDKKVTTSWSFDTDIWWRAYWSNPKSPKDGAPCGVLRSSHFKSYFRWDAENACLEEWSSEKDYRASKEIEQKADTQNDKKKKKPKEVFHQKYLHQVCKLEGDTPSVEVVFLKEAIPGVKSPVSKGVSPNPSSDSDLQSTNKRELKLEFTRNAEAEKWFSYLQVRLRETKQRIREQKGQKNLDQLDMKPRPGVVLNPAIKGQLGKFPPPKAQMKGVKMERYAGKVVEISLRIMSLNSCKFEEGTFQVQFLLFMTWLPEDNLVTDWLALQGIKDKIRRKKVTVKGPSRCSKGHQINGSDEAWNQIKAEWTALEELNKLEKELWNNGFYWNAENEVSLVNMVENADVAIGAVLPKLVKIPEVNDGKYTALSVRPFTATINQDWALKGFPFDTQILRLIFRPRESLDLVFLKPNDGPTFGTVMSPYCGLAIPEWQVYKPRLHATVDYFSLNRPYSCMVVGMPIRRNPTFHMFNILLITWFLQLLSFSCYFIPVDDVGDRLGVEVSLLLTSTAFKLSIAESIPKVSYLTIADRFILHTIVLQSLFSVVICVSFLVSKGGFSEHWQTNKADAENVDIFFGVVFALWLLYLGLFARTCYGYWKEGFESLKNESLVAESTTNYLFRKDNFDTKPSRVWAFLSSLPCACFRWLQHPCLWLLSRAYWCCKGRNPQEKKPDTDKTSNPNKPYRKHKADTWYNVPDDSVPWFMDYESHQPPQSFRLTFFQQVPALLRQLSGNHYALKTPHDAQLAVSADQESKTTPSHSTSISLVGE